MQRKKGASSRKKKKLAQATDDGFLTFCLCTTVEKDNL